ncbi:hypothetical protein FRB99_008062 [Tulasnella sp. 403]|nr:hypothetical protein FRB99_008062 [Tulasnella sp. 403]
MADQPPPGMTAPTPKPSSSIISPPTDNNSPESQNTQPLSPNLPPPSDSPSPTSPTDTGPSTRRYGHGRIASTSTSTSRPEGYPSWLPHRPPPPEPPSTAGVGTRPSTRAGFESPDSLGDGDFVDWEFVTPGPGDDFTPRAQRYSEEQVRMPEPEEAGPSSAQVPSQTRRHTHPGLPASSPSSPIAPKGERKPTPRSVRIVSAVGLGPALTHGQQPTSSREATDSTRVPSGSLPGYRAFSRATGASALSPTLYGSFPSTAGFGTGLKFSEGRAGKMRRSMIPTALHPSAPLPTSTMPVVPPPVRPPRFRTPKFHPTLLRDPSAWTKARWWAWGVIVVLGHVVFQTFLDFNIAYMLIQVAKHPTITPLSTRSSQRNWTLASVAYIICWALWLFGVVLIYEAVYCFWRRWRVKRPLLIPIYLSSPAYNYVCLTSYTNFCFLQHIRLSALNMYNTVIDHEAPGGIEQRPGAPGETRREVSEGKKPVRRGGDPEKTDDWEEIRKPEGDDRPRISGDEETRLASASAPPVAKSSSHSNSHSDPVSYTNPSAHGTNSHGNTSSPHGNTDSPKPGSGNGSRHSPPQQPSPKSHTGTVLGVDNGVGRDGTFFAGRGQLTTIALWIFSGLGCAGLCGPRYRWEEASTAPEQEEELPLPYGGSEKRRSAALSTASHTLGQSSTHPRTEGRRTDSTAAPMPGSQRLSMYTVADSRFAERTGRRAFLDPDDHTLNWPWMERCRDRIWDVWEFCLVRSDGTRGSEADPYWLAWRTALAGGDGAGQGAAAGVSEKQAAGPSGSQAVPGVPFPSASREPGSSFSGVVPTPLSAAFSATTTAAGTPIPFLTSGSRSYTPGTPGASAAYAPLDTVLSTLPEVSSNPSLAASSVPAVPLAGVPISVMPAAPQQPYSFPAYSTSPSMPQGDKPILPFPLPTGTPPAEQQASSQERRSQNIFPTPATTVQSLPFPVPQQPLSPPPMSEGQPMTEYLDDEPFLTGEHGQLALHSRAASGSGTGSMSSLGQPIQTRYPFGLGRGRGRQSSASGSGSVVTSSNRDSGGSVSLAGSHQMQQSSRGSLQSGSGSGYGTHAHVRSMRSRSTRLSAISGGAYDEGGAGEVYLYPEDHDDHEEVDVGSRLSSPVEAGMAGVGAGGGVGPRPSLVGLASPTSPMSMATSQGYEIPPPPRHPQGGRRRAGTLPSPTSPTGPSVPSVPPIDTAVSRTRVASVPSAPSPVTRTYFSPISAQELDMPAFAPEYGADDDEDDADIEEDEGSQEAAEKEDSVGLLSQGPSRRSSASGLNLRSRASNISLHRRTNGSRSVSITSAGGGGVRSRAASLIQAAAPRLGSHSPPGSHSQSRESLHSAGSPVAEQTPVPRSRVDSGTASGGRAEGTTSHTSHYSDARSRTHSDNSGPHPRGPDETFGVQIDWRSDQPEAPGAFPDDPATIRPRPSRITAPAPTFEGIIPTIREPEDLASRSRPPEAQPEPGPSRTQPINIPQASRADLSSANASFVTALPSVVTESSTETAGRSSSGSDAWARGRTQRYFVEGSGFPGPR